MQQDYIFQSIRAALILTGSYVAGTVLDYSNTNPALRNQLNILLDLTIGSLTSAQLKVEYSNDGSDYYQETFMDVSGATATCSLGEYSFAGTGKYTISIPIKASYIRISLKGTGTLTGSSAKVGAVIGTA